MNETLKFQFEWKEEKLRPWIFDVWQIWRIESEMVLSASLSNRTLHPLRFHPLVCTDIAFEHISRFQVLSECRLVWKYVWLHVFVFKCESVWVLISSFVSLFNYMWPFTGDFSYMQTFFQIEQFVWHQHLVFALPF